MQAGRTVDADPNQELMLGQERTPLVIQQRSVGLDGVGNLPTVREGRLEFHHPAEELETRQGRFSPLPGEPDDRYILSLDVLSDELPQHLVGHLEPPVPVEQLLLLEVEAVRAVQIADRPDRLRHHTKRPHPRWIRPKIGHRHCPCR